MSIENGINNILSTTAKAVGDLISKIAYTYDEYGNRKSMIRTGVGESSVSYTYDMNNRLLSETKGIYDRTEITDYTYDPNGNQLYKVSGSSQNTHTNESEGVNIWLTKPEESYYEKYEYNLFNRLTEVQKNGITSTYTYDGNGQRQSKEAKGVTTNHIWSGGNIVAETKADGEIKSNYYYGLKLYGLETPVIDTYDVCDAYYSYNGHGDVTKLVGTDGKVIINYDYDAFGNEIGNDYTIYNPFHYNGQYTDFEGETGLIYLRNRYYDPSIGRFTQEDPAQDGLNWYVYCANDPVNFIDPLGLEYLVVSGSEYDENRWKYNFVEPAIKKIKELKELNDGEWITWIVSSTGYSEEALQYMNDIAYELGVGFETIGSSAELQNYINSQDINTWELSGKRLNDPIRKFVVFSHGVPGSVELGYHQYNSEQLSLDYKWTRGVFSQAFDNPNSMFYSCNTGTDQDRIWGTNFAQAWVNVVGGRTMAARGRTSYDNIMNEVFSNKWSRGNLFSKDGSDNYPVASSGVNWMNFGKWWWI